MSVAFSPKITFGIPGVTPQEVLSALGKIRVIDVRTPEEFAQGHIATAENIPLGPMVFQVLGQGDRKEQIVFVCHSGSRSGHVTQLAVEWGFRNVYNMSGGMMDWQDLELPIEKTQKSK